MGAASLCISPQQALLAPLPAPLHSPRSLVTSLPAACRLADSLFQPLYKANMKLLKGQGEELQRLHSAANHHAAFVLHIRCI